ncbi:MAG: hypothetical protein LBT30_04220 [Clostridiales bacterium]|jgi:g-D-glutamyl-meso-diaminopimelate peptidase|nr:hypothetical protein [Clostridiales bacterium]
MTVEPLNIIKDVYKSISVFKKQGYETGYIGRTVLGSPIPYVKKGDGSYGGTLIFGAIHAREYITAPLVTKMAENYSGKSAIYFVPVVDIDGVALVTLGIDAISAILDRPSSALNPLNPCFFYGEKGFEAYRASLPKRKVSDTAAYLIKINGGGSDFRLWKANVDAVDLNVNFDAGWGTGLQNTVYPAPANYIGPYPESEPETKALVNFTKQHDIITALCYHCKGEVIYYGYKNNAPYPELAAMFSDATGYPLLSSQGSAGGYKDWFTEQFDSLSLTVEVGGEGNTYDELNDRFDQIYAANADVPTIADYATRKILGL